MLATVSEQLGFLDFLQQPQTIYVFSIDIIQSYCKATSPQFNPQHFCNSDGYHTAITTTALPF